jgi:hypothetical protein
VIFELPSDPNSQDDSANTTGNTPLENSKTIPVEVLIQLSRAGFRKLVPLLSDSKRANAYGDLITEDESKEFPLAEAKPVRIIYQQKGLLST